MKLTFILMLAVANIAGAASINSGDGIGETNNVTGVNVIINPHPAWSPNADGKWISYAQTGYEGSEYPPNTSFDVPTASFLELFNVTHISQGSVTVWADDTADVWLNGTQIASHNPVQDGACAAGPIGCEIGEGLTLNLTPYLHTGVNSLWFVVYQRGTAPGGLPGNGEPNPFGVKYSGAVSDVHAPEPGSMILMIVGIALIAATRYKAVHRLRH